MKKIGLGIFVTTMIGFVLVVYMPLQAQTTSGKSNGPLPSGQSKKTDRWDDAVSRVLETEKLKEEAEAGNPGSQAVLGMMYESGSGVKQDYKQAIFWYRKAADQGFVLAQFNLGRMYADGQGVEQDYKQAAGWYRKAAEQGDVTAQFHLGWMYYFGQGVEKDSTQSAQWYRKAAEQGDTPAQHNLGVMYDEGQGIERDPKQAVQWLRKAAEQGYVKSQVRLGVMYDTGQGVEQDSKQAAKWYLKAADQGDATAQFALGVKYSYGKGVEKDDTQAALWYRKAAEQGLIFAQYSLGVMYGGGLGVQKDPKEAEKWLRRAAEQGYGKSQKILGDLYSVGYGVIEDFVEAYKWFLLAGMNGEDVSQQKENLKMEMTPSQIAEAQRLAKEFVPRKEGEGGNEADRPKDLKTTGTGFFIDAKGTILTANHVIEKAKTIRIMAGDKILDAKVVAADAGLDIAILKVEGQGFEWLPIAASAPVKAGEKIFTVGYPNYAIQGTEPKYTEGVVNSVTGAMNNPRLFQVSAQVQPGNSGGPLVTEAGQVIGVVVQRLSDLGMLEATGMVAQSVNYAVKSSFVLPLLEGVEGWTRPEGKAEKPNRTAIIERARKAAVMVMGY